VLNRTLLKQDLVPQKKYGREEIVLTPQLPRELTSRRIKSARADLKKKLRAHTRSSSENAPNNFKKEGILFNKKSKDISCLTT